MSLIWASLPEALLSGLLATVATELFGNLVLHPPAITLPHIYTNVPPGKGPQITINEAHSHQGDLPIPGKSTGPYVYNPPKGAHGQPVWGTAKNGKQGFIDAAGNVWVWDMLHKDHWDVQHKDGTYTNVKPDGEPGQGKPHQK